MIFRGDSGEARTGARVRYGCENPRRSPDEHADLPGDLR